VPGVSSVVVVDSTLRCQVIGPMAPLLKAFAEFDVRSLLCRAPSLEELFLAHYSPHSESPTGQPG
jgi:ABC-2 type transport system ATP-binding protein